MTPYGGDVNLRNFYKFLKLGLEKAEWPGYACNNITNFYKKNTTSFNDGEVAKLKVFLKDRCYLKKEHVIFGNGKIYQIFKKIQFQGHSTHECMDKHKLASETDLA